MNKSEIESRRTSTAMNENHFDTWILVVESHVLRAGRARTWHVPRHLARATNSRQLRPSVRLQPSVLQVTY